MLTPKTVNDHSKPKDRLSDLPHHILEKILYFLSRHEAAQTSALSKQWRYIWNTRPNVAFSDKTFKGTEQEFISTVKNTLQQYHDRRMCLDEFHLSLAKYSDESLSLLEEWIPRLAHVGVKEFCLSIVSKHSNKDQYPLLPWLVFEAGCLHELHVRRYKLDRTASDHHHRTITLKHLKLLHLHEVQIREDQDILQSIISRCPSVETMIIDSCEGLREVKLGNLSNLKNLSFTGYEMSRSEKSCRIEIHEALPSLETITILFSTISFRPQEFRNLNRLHLVHVRFGFFISDHLSSCKFPNLEYLTLRDCYGFEESPLFIDAPKIVRFVYAGKFIPSISFATTFSSSLWDSTLDLTWDPRRADFSWWLIKLSKLLEQLSTQSTIVLRVHQYSMSNLPDVQEDLFVQPVEVERLQLSRNVFLYQCLLNGLFRICRPRKVGNYVYRDKEVPELLGKILMEGESKSGYELWGRDLEDVRMEIYEKNRDEWDEVTLSEYLKPKERKGEYKDTRFRLTWRRSNNL